MLEQILPASVLISLLISYVLGGRFLTISQVAAAAGIIVGFIVVLQYTVNESILLDKNLRIISGVIGMVIIVCLAVILIIIPFLKSSNKFKLFGKRISRKPKLQSATRPSIFDAEIVNKKQAYVRGVDSVSFRSHFKGNLVDGYFMNKISAQIPTGVHDVSAYLFHHRTPNIESSRRYVVLYHPETADIWHENIGKKIVGKLNGDVDTGWLYVD